jgi:hypothetical protein
MPLLELWPRSVLVLRLALPLLLLLQPEFDLVLLASVLERLGLGFVLGLLGFEIVLVLVRVGFALVQ